MSNSRLFFTILVVAGFVALGFIWNSARRRVGEEQAQASLQSSISALIARQQQLDTKLAAVERKRDELKKAQMNSAVSELVRSSRLRPIPPPAGLSARDPQVLAENPELQRLYLASRRAELTAKYRALAISTGLTIEQTGKLIDLLLQNDEANLDVFAVARAQGLSLSDPVLATLRDGQLASLHAAEVELLGQDGYSRLQAFDESAPVRESAADFAGKAALADIPITAVQMNQLVGLTTKYLARFHETHPEQRNGSTSAWSGHQLDWPAFDQEAAAFLSPSQLELLQRVGAYPVIDRAGGALMAAEQLLKKISAEQGQR